MAKKYDFKKTERKWQKAWERARIYEAKDFSKKPKYYCLIEFPYPSGEGLHVGHVRSYTAMDIVARKRRMQGHNVLYPIGWDAFGLPTENYAIKTGTPPAQVTKKNTDNYRRQLKALNFSFDWSREVNTSSPEYYRWTQWMFLQFFKHGLAYKANVPINWCPQDKIGLANEEVIDGHCERCGSPVEKRNKEQWMLKITAYAEQLLDGLKDLDFLPEIKTQQINWIGKSEGAEIDFPVTHSQARVRIFTTRPDTIFGATYLVLAPEHPLVKQLEPSIRNLLEVQHYVAAAKKKSEEERGENKEKTGKELRGVHAVNPATREEIPIWISDYVLPGYGTGAIMAVPAHDARDFAFAEKFHLPVKRVVSSQDEKEGVLPYEGTGTLINSGQFTGMHADEARSKIVGFVHGEKKIQYKLRDWVFSRQRYWGEPIPLIHCPSCALRDPSGQGYVPVPEKNLPVKLPKVKDYRPRDDGESPLASVESWVNVRCPQCKGKAKRETDVMPNWAGSSWYFLRYPDAKNKKVFADQKKLAYYLPVDWYNGGMEHVTLHLLYSRFWNRFLYDIGVSPVAEPYKKRTTHGLILGSGGIKMSKSKGNVVNPDEVVKVYGADVLRLYEMFMGPFDQAIAWDHKGIEGTNRFLMKVWSIAHEKEFVPKAKDETLTRLLHKTIKKVGEDIEALAMNTAVSALMIFVNECQKRDMIPAEIWHEFLKLLAPFAPALTEELWQKGKKTASFSSIHLDSWPRHDEKLIHEDTFVMAIQINGKLRDTVEISRALSEAEARDIALSREKVKAALGKKKIRRVVFVPGRLVNIVTQ